MSIFNLFTASMSPYVCMHLQSENVNLQEIKLGLHWLIEQPVATQQPELIKTHTSSSNMELNSMQDRKKLLMIACAQLVDLACITKSRKMQCLTYIKNYSWREGTTSNDKNNIVQDI